MRGCGGNLCCPLPPTPMLPAGETSGSLPLGTDHAAVMGAMALVDVAVSLSTSREKETWCCGKDCLRAGLEDSVRGAATKVFVYTPVRFFIKTEGDVALTRAGKERCGENTGLPAWW